MVREDHGKEMKRKGGGTKIHGSNLRVKRRYDFQATLGT
jgi:hypothetical protein